MHIDGEIYGAIGWRLGELFSENGLTTGELLDYVVDGMNYTPANPKFEQMRDGILQAAPAGVNCLIWRGFAKYGVGVGASATFKGTRVTIKESFAVPAAARLRNSQVMRRGGVGIRSSCADAVTRRNSPQAHVERRSSAHRLSAQAGWNRRKEDWRPPSR